MPHGQAAGRRVFLHVGTPKSGTSFIQASLLSNREQLAKQGVLYPAKNQTMMFRAASEMRERHTRSGTPPSDLAGTWAELCARAREFTGSSVISNELLGGANDAQVGRMLDELSGLEVHVVVTARNLARQFPAAWQQGAKHGRRQTFAQYRRLVTTSAEQRSGSDPFWRGHDVPGVLARWGATLPPSNVHVVTVAPNASDPELLWRRFCSVIGVDPTGHPPTMERTNVSLGITEIELLNRVNAVVKRRDEGRRLARLVNRYLVRDVLRQYTSPRAGTPPDLLPLFQGIARDWVSTIEAAGYDVVGDLAELVPDDAEWSDVDPDHVPDDDVITLAASTIVDLLTEIDRLRSQRPGPPPGDKAGHRVLRLARKLPGRG